MIGAGLDLRRSRVRRSSFTVQPIRKRLYHEVGAGCEAPMNFDWMPSIIAGRNGKKCGSVAGDPDSRAGMRAARRLDEGRCRLLQSLFLPRVRREAIVTRTVTVYEFDD